MKRFLLSMLLCLSITILPAAPMPLRLPAPAGPLHAPALGGLALGDIGGGAPGTNRGIIMNTILTEPSFANEVSAVKNFLNIAPGAHIPHTYQQIVQIICTSTDANGAIAVIKAFERALMHKYDYDNYLVGSYGPWRSIVFTGLKYNIFAHDPNLTQIINEIESLAKVAAQHSLPEATRMKAIVASHRFWQHWKQYLVGAAVAYVTIDTCKHIKNKTLTKESIWSDLLYGGIINGIPAIASKAPDNLYSAAQLGYKFTAGSAKLAYSWTKPIVDRVLYGVADNKQPKNPDSVFKRIQEILNRPAKGYQIKVA